MSRRTRGVPRRGRLRYSPHAREVMLQRAVGRHEVEFVVRQPEASYPSQGRTVYQRGELAVVVAGVWVVTVLQRCDLSNEPRWSDADVRRRSA